MDVAFDVGAKLGESPVWSPEEGLLYWIDINGCAVHASNPATGTTRSWNLDGRPGAMARTSAPGRVLVGVENELVWLDLESGQATPWVVLEEPQPGVRLNDGRTDPAGRFWIGGMHDPTSAGRYDGYLHRVEHDGAFETVRSAVGCANGSAFSPDGSIMYWADTLQSLVWAYDYDVDTGRQHNERVFLDFEHLPGRPDGACVDETGCYWIACVGGGALLRVTPDGAVDRTVEVPVPLPTMPAFGGAGLDTIFITSIGDRDPASDESAPPGAVFAFDPGVAGIPEPMFGG